MNNNTYIHKYLKSLIDKDDICVDMTAGNGNDTFYLASRCKTVYAFDISELAIERTKQRIKDFDNVILIQDNHINVDKYIEESVNLFIFNLGYLPDSDESSITKADETLIAFKKAYELLQDNGYIVITFYLGQKGGYDEYYLLEDYINKNRLHITEIYSQHKLNSPVTFFIKKSN